MVGAGPVHGSASGALIIWWPFELVFGDCHGLATKGCALLSHGSIGCGGDFDSHGSTVAGMFRMVLPLVPIGADPLLWSHPSFEEPEAAEGDWVRDSQLSTLAVPVGRIAVAPADGDCQGSTGEVEDVCDHGSATG